MQWSSLPLSVLKLRTCVLYRCVATVDLHPMARVLRVHSKNRIRLGGKDGQIWLDVENAMSLGFGKVMPLGSGGNGVAT